MSSTPQRLDGYIRVSRRNGRDGATYMSPDLQREAIERWAAYKGVEIVAWHVDEDESGGASSRPGLDLARERCLAGDTNGIVSWKIDRFSRNTAQGLTDLKLLQSKDARLAFTAEDIDTNTTQGKFFYTVQLANAEMFLDNMRDQWRGACTKARERGAFIAKTPFGYRRIAKGEEANDPRAGMLVPDPRWGPVVTNAFEIAATSGLHTTVTYLEQAAAHKTWNTDSTRKLLHNKVYLGEAHGRPAHAPLTSESTFLAAHSKPQSRRGNGEYPLSGIARCARCRGGLVGQLQTVKGRMYRRYRCANTRACGGGSSINADVLEGYVRTVLERALAEDDFRDAFAPEGLEKARAGLEEAGRDRTRWQQDNRTRDRIGEGEWASELDRLIAIENERRAVYGTLAGQSAQHETLPLADELDDPAQWQQALRAFATKAIIVVARGRGTVGNRVTFAPLDEGDDVTRSLTA